MKPVQLLMKVNTATEARSGLASGDDAPVDTEFVGAVNARGVRQLAWQGPKELGGEGGRVQVP